MKKYLRGEVLKLAKFMDKDISPDQMDKVLQSTNHKGDLREEKCLIKKVIVGDYKNIMKPEIIAKFDICMAKTNRHKIIF